MRWKFAVGVLAALAVLTVACGGSSSVSGPQSSAKPIDVSVGMAFADPLVVPFWIASDRKIYNKYGLNVTMTQLQGDTPTVQALVGGSIQVALVGATGIINAASQGAAVVMVGGLLNKMAEDFIVAPSITSASQLVGKTCMVSSKGSSSDLMVRYSLQKVGVDPSKVTIVTGGNEVTRLAALRAGQIHCTVLTAGLDTAACRLGFKPMLKLYETNQPLAQASISVNKDWLAKNGDTVERMLKALTEALVYVRNSDNLEAVVDVAQPHQRGVSKEDLIGAYKLYGAEIFPQYPALEPAGIQFILDSKGLTDPVSKYYDGTHVKKLQDSNFAQSVPNK